MYTIYISKNYAMLCFLVVTVQFTVSDKDYMGKLSNHAMLQCSVFAHVKEKDQYWIGKATQQFTLPAISFSFPSGSGNAKKGEQSCLCSQLHFYAPINVLLSSTLVVLVRH